MFHWVKGVPFELNAGAFDNLNMWEQMDGGAQYTPAKKFLTAVPIVLYVPSDFLRVLISQVLAQHTLYALSVFNVCGQPVGIAHGAGTEASFRQSLPGPLLCLFY